MSLLVFFSDYVLRFDRAAANFAEATWGTHNLAVVAALAVAWVIVFLVLVKGVESFGKVWKESSSSSS